MKNMDSENKVSLQLSYQIVVDMSLGTGQFWPQWLLLSELVRWKNNWINKYNCAKLAEAIELGGLSDPRESLDMEF